MDTKSKTDKQGSENFRDSVIRQTNVKLLLLKLSRAEGRVLREVVKDETNDEIADELGLSVRTVEKHIQNIRAEWNLPVSLTLKEWIDEIWQ